MLLLRGAVISSWVDSSSMDSLVSVIVSVNFNYKERASTSGIYVYIYF